MTIHTGELPVHGVKSVQLMQQKVPSDHNSAGYFYTVSVVVEDGNGERKKIATLYDLGDNTKIKMAIWTDEG
jgi:hypothetical protein